MDTEPGGAALSTTGSGVGLVAATRLGTGRSETAGIAGADLGALACGAGGAFPVAVRAVAVSAATGIEGAGRGLVDAVIAGDACAATGVEGGWGLVDAVTGGDACAAVGVEGAARAGAADLGVETGG
jgi:hypothetical protein